MCFINMTRLQLCEQMRGTKATKRLHAEASPKAPIFTGTLRASCPHCTALCITERENHRAMINDLDKALDHTTERRWAYSLGTAHREGQSKVLMPEP